MGVFGRPTYEKQVLVDGPYAGTVDLANKLGALAATSPGKQAKLFICNQKTFNGYKNSNQKVYGFAQQTSERYVMEEITSHGSFNHGSQVAGTTADHWKHIYAARHVEGGTGKYLHDIKLLGFLDRANNNSWKGSNRFVLCSATPVQAFRAKVANPYYPNAGNPFNEKKGEGFVFAIAGTMGEDKFNDPTAEEDILDYINIVYTDKNNTANTMVINRSNVTMSHPTYIASLNMTLVYTNFYYEGETTVSGGGPGGGTGSGSTHNAWTCKDAKIETKDKDGTSIGSIDGCAYEVSVGYGIIGGMDLSASASALGATVTLSWKLASGASVDSNTGQLQELINGNWVEPTGAPNANVFNTDGEASIPGVTPGIHAYRIAYVENGKLKTTAVREIYMGTSVFTRFDATQSDSNSLNPQWNTSVAGTEQKGFALYRREKGAETFVFVTEQTNSSALSHQDTGAVKGKEYQYYIEVTMTNGEVYAAESDYYLY
ncbi:hypothetical protein [Algivirga pacifica]|uniref:Uncharacterized protein n=1 Tax=Algivirga pacifica TaxID=1162670 RepID=A0ABP9DGK8_9BACT